MNDADNNNTDNEAGLRTSDIYERFLNRVQNINSEDDFNDNNLEANNVESLKRVEKPATYEPLNEEELRLFTDHEQEVGFKESGSTSIDISFSDDDKVTNDEDEVADLSELSTDDEPTHNNDNLATELEINSSINLSSKKTGALWGKQVSSGKLLIIGVVCGLLLSALIVLTLNAMGVLAALTDSLAPNNTQIATTNTSDPAANSEQSINEDITTKTDNPNVDNLHPNDSDKAVPAPPISKQNEAKNNTSNSITNKSTVAGTDISYEDFREEAQSTLYRETKD